MPDYQKMYVTAFNAMTCALEELDKLNIGTAKEQLRTAQSQTEEMYMSEGGEESALETGSDEE